MWQFIIAGFTLGAVSSLHCVGMCGPLSMALPIQYLFKWQRVISILLYQVGRVITYSGLGLVFGLAGRRVYLAGLQQWFSIIMGLLILVLLIQYWIFRKNISPGFVGRFYFMVQNAMRRILKQRGMLPFLFFGIANGFLPCAMVYVALGGALVTAEVSHSVIFMAMFGLGTLPAMFAVNYFRQFFSLSLRNAFRKAVPVFVGLMGLLLILRGLNLDIPFVSPVVGSAQGAAIECH